MPPHSLTNFEIQKYYQNLKFTGVYSRNNLSKIKDGAFIINIDEYESVGTHWIALHVNDNNVTYCDSFGVTNIEKEIKKFIGNKNVVKIFIEYKIWFNNVRTLLYWIYWFHVKR